MNRASRSVDEEERRRYLALLEHFNFSSRLLLMEHSSTSYRSMIHFRERARLLFSMTVVMVVRPAAALMRRQFPHPPPRVRRPRRLFPTSLLRCFPFPLHFFVRFSFRIITKTVTALDPRRNTLRNCLSFLQN